MSGHLATIASADDSTFIERQAHAVEMCIAFVQAETNERLPRQQEPTENVRKTPCPDRALTLRAEPEIGL